MSVVGVSRTSFSFQQKKGRPHNKHFGKRVRCVGESVFKQKKIANIITYKIHHPIQKTQQKRNETDKSYIDKCILLKLVGSDADIVICLTHR